MWGRMICENQLGVAAEEPGQVPLSPQDWQVTRGQPLFVATTRTKLPRPSPKKTRFFLITPRPSSSVTYPITSDEKPASSAIKVTESTSDARNSRIRKSGLRHARPFRAKSSRLVPGQGVHFATFGALWDELGQGSHGCVNQKPGASRPTIGNPRPRKPILRTSWLEFQPHRPDLFSSLLITLLSFLSLELISIPTIPTV